MAFRRIALPLFALLCWCSAIAQSPAQKSPQPVPMPHLYWHFLTIQNHLDREAAAMQTQGQDPAPVRDFYQKKLGFDNKQFGKVRQAAQSLEPKLKQIDTQAKAIVDGVHAKYPPQLGVVPPLPPQLQTLMKQREAAIQQATNQLKTALGPKDAATLDGFVQKQIAPTVTRREISIPDHVRDPQKSPVAPFNKGVN